MLINFQFYGFIFPGLRVRLDGAVGGVSLGWRRVDRRCGCGRQLRTIYSAIRVVTIGVDFIWVSVMVHR